MRWIAHIEGCPKRVNHAAVAVNHKVYSFGGYSTGEDCRGYTSMDVHVLNTHTNRWVKHPVSDLPYFENDDILPYRRYGHTAVVYKDNIYIWGGRNDRSSCSILFKFDTFWHCWMAPPTTGSVPLARDGHTACVWKNYMFIFGGYEEETDLFAKQVFYLDFEKLHWSYIVCGGYEPTLRDFHTTVCIKDRIYLFGGRGTILTTNLQGVQSPLETYCNKVWYLDMKTFNWHCCKATGDIPVGRRSNSAFVHNGKMYIFGGYNSVKSKHYNDLYVFDPETCVWTKLHPQGTSPCARRRQACAKVGDKVFIFGGTSPHVVNDVEELNDASGLDGLVDHSDMYILDLNPSLKTLCMLTVREYNLDESSLPQSLRTELTNMHLPNKITQNRPNNASG
ncbi:kelch domain-containing protein 3-like [Rhynchophorus ferrugineus]|uniref:kelch domain-containing protein 3-like n=1 Tax=Rhynchophorus ferrugineus TaxID=354439 RepID=UPI003FCDF3DC